MKPLRTTQPLTSSGPDTLIHIVSWRDKGRAFESFTDSPSLQCGTVQCGAVLCSALQCVAARCSALQCIAVQRSELQCVAVQPSLPSHPMGTATGHTCSTFLSPPCACTRASWASLHMCYCLQTAWPLGVVCCLVSLQRVSVCSVSKHHTSTPGLNGRLRTTAKSGNEYMARYRLHAHVCIYTQRIMWMRNPTVCIHIYVIRVRIHVYVSHRPRKW